jgi:MoaA/NifB/PqqE/SkfB family radical SAM enzyme
LENVLAADLFVSVHITLTPQNIDIVQSVMQRLANEGVKTISLTASDPGLQNSLIQSRNQAASLNMSLVWDLPVPYSAFNPIALETQMDNLPLGAGHTWLYIEPDGDVHPAQGINQVLGNVLSDPWEKLWQ